MAVQMEMPMEKTEAAGSMRVGLGYDSHRFDHQRTLRLCGVEVPNTPGLAGHSDADCALHALTDALLGAAGMPDIGELFPPTDERYRGADSTGLLKQALERIRERHSGFRVVNIDLVIIAETPRIAPHKPAMRRRLAELLEVDEGAVSLKGKTNEGMGWVGEAEGIAAWCAVLAAL